MSLEAWAGWRTEERQVWLDGLLERLPRWLGLVEAPPGPTPQASSLPVFEDARFDQRFVLVFEATVVIGLTEGRLAEVQAALERDWLQLFSPEVHVPSREVRVGGHFAGLRPMAFEGHEWVHRDNRGRLVDALAQRAWRLPSEAEWELEWRVARAYAPIEFGQVELCADDWHVGYGDAPLDASPWGGGAEVVRQWDSAGESVDSVFPARRPVRSTSITQVRPVIDLPF